MAIELEVEPSFVRDLPNRLRAESALLDAKQRLLPVLDCLEDAYRAAIHGEPSGEAAKRVYKMVEVISWLSVMINTWREMYPIVEVSSRQ